VFDKKTWTKANRARINAQSLAWYYRNKAAVLANVRRYQARKTGATCGCCAPISFKFIYLQARCLKMEVDHVQPLSKGGKHCLWNLQLLDRHENRVKHARWSPA
jgi:5-methylcytosine-specific restriction endonuclease McrA